MLWTESQGDYNLDVNITEQHIVGDYGLISTFSANDDESGVPYLSVEDAEAIAKAWENGIPVRVMVDAYYTTVTDVSTSFIGMSGMGTNGVPVVSYAFRRDDGKLYSSNTMYLGNVFENGDNFPKMYINNRWYKITVGSDSTLKATQV